MDNDCKQNVWMKNVNRRYGRLTQRKSLCQGKKTHIMLIREQAALLYFQFSWNLFFGQEAIQRVRTCRPLTELVYFVNPKIEPILCDLRNRFHEVTKKVSTKSRCCNQTNRLNRSKQGIYAQKCINKLQVLVDSSV